MQTNHCREFDEVCQYPISFSTIDNATPAYFTMSHGRKIAWIICVIYHYLIYLSNWRCNLMEICYSKHKFNAYIKLCVRGWVCSCWCLPLSAKIWASHTWNMLDKPFPASLAYGKQNILFRLDGSSVNISDDNTPLIVVHWWWRYWDINVLTGVILLTHIGYPDSKVHGAHLGPAEPSGPFY